MLNSYFQPIHPGPLKPMYFISVHVYGGFRVYIWFSGHEKMDTYFLLYIKLPSFWGAGKVEEKIGEVNNPIAGNPQLLMTHS